jgi:hypothetical protein
MVIIETMYEDCLPWFSLKNVFQQIQFTNEKLNGNNAVNHNKLIKYAIKFYNQIVFSNEEIFCYIRRFTLHL